MVLRQTRLTNKTTHNFALFQWLVADVATYTSPQAPLQMERGCQLVDGGEVKRGQVRHCKQCLTVMGNYKKQISSTYC